MHISQNQQNVGDSRFRYEISDWSRRFCICGAHASKSVQSSARKLSVKDFLSFAYFMKRISEKESPRVLLFKPLKVNWKSYTLSKTCDAFSLGVIIEFTQYIFEGIKDIIKMFFITPILARSQRININGRIFFIWFHERKRNILSLPSDLKSLFGHPFQ